MVLLGDIFPLDWAAIAAVLTGTGALLAGIAALRRSKLEGKKEAREQMQWEEEHKHDKTISLP